MSWSTSCSSNGRLRRASGASDESGALSADGSAPTCRRGPAASEAAIVDHRLGAGRVAVALAEEVGARRQLQRDRCRRVGDDTVTRSGRSVLAWRADLASSPRTHRSSAHRARSQTLGRRPPETRRRSMSPRPWPPRSVETARRTRSADDELRVVTLGRRRPETRPAPAPSRVAIAGSASPKRCGVIGDQRADATSSRPTAAVDAIRTRPTRDVGSCGGAASSDG